MSDLQPLIRRVAEARQALAVPEREYAEHRAAFDAEFATLIERITAAKTELAIAELELRKATAAAFVLTGNKKPAEGVGIRVSRAIDYPDDMALSWAIDHKMCLALDTKSFKDIMLAYSEQQRPEWVHVFDNPTATIATDLSAYLTDGQS